MKKHRSARSASASRSSASSRSCCAAGEGPARRPVTVTAVEVSPDLSHAKVFFTHLAGQRARATRRSTRSRAPRASCARELAHRLKLYRCPQLHFAYDDSIESGMRLSQLIDEAVAGRQRSFEPADARRRAPRCSATSPRRARRRRAAARQAARASRRTPRCSARKRAVPRRKGGSHRDARPAGLGAAAALLRRGDQVRARRCSTRARRTSRRCASASRRRPATRKATSSRRVPVAFDARRRSQRRCRVSSARIDADAARATRRSSIAGPQLLRIRARGHRDPARAARGQRPSSSSCSTGTPPDAMLDVACGKGTYVRVLAEDIGEALGCGAHLAGAAPNASRRLRARRRGDARSAARRWRDARLRRPIRCLRRSPVTRPSTSTLSGALRVGSGRAVAALPHGGRDAPLPGLAGRLRRRRRRRRWLLGRCATRPPDVARRQPCIGVSAPNAMESLENRKHVFEL